MAALGTVRTALHVAGTVRVPGDKSVSHRALMLAALGRGVSTIRGVLRSEDVRSTAGVLGSLGWTLPAIGSEMRVQGAGLRSPALAPSGPLDCGNSGTTARLVAGIAAAQQFTSTFTGDASLSRRPMQRVTDPLVAMGAGVEWIDAEGRLPMRVRGGPLHSLDWELPVASAQIKSAVLLAALCARVRARVREPAPTRDHTEQMLRACGVPVTATADGWIALEPVDAIPGRLYDVPGDPSSAAFFLALGALADAGVIQVEGVLSSPFRNGFARALARMGARIESRPHGEPTSTDAVAWSVEGGAPLRAIDITPADVPSMIDELPLLAVVAARAEGETVVRGASELRVKESDRIAVTVANLRSIGVAAEELPDGFVVRGTDAPLRGSVQSHGDHRIAMAFGTLGATRNCDVTIDDMSCVSVSYPEFWHDLRRVTA